MSRRTVPAFLSFHVEPDRYQLGRDGPATWAGYDDLHDVVSALRPVLAERQGEAPCFSWMLRMDPQIEATCPTVDHAASGFGDRVERLASHGDVFGIHVHPIRWSEPRWRLGSRLCRPCVGPTQHRDVGRGVHERVRDTAAPALLRCGVPGGSRGRHSRGAGNLGRPHGRPQVRPAGAAARSGGRDDRRRHVADRRNVDRRRSRAAVPVPSVAHDRDAQTAGTADSSSRCR